MNLPENKNEFLFIKLESYTEGNAALVSTIIQEVVGAAAVYAPTDLKQPGKWPTIAKLVSKSVNKSIVFFSLFADETSELVFPLNERAMTPELFSTETTCPAGNVTDGFWRVQGGASTIEVKYLGQVSIVYICMHFTTDVHTASHSRVTHCVL
jgi:hypothetical protein